MHLPAGERAPASAHLLVGTASGAVFRYQEPCVDPLRPVFEVYGPILALGHHWDDVVAMYKTVRNGHELVLLRNLTRACEPHPFAGIPSTTSVQTYVLSEGTLELRTNGGRLSFDLSEVTTTMRYQNGWSTMAFRQPFSWNDYHCRLYPRATPGYAPAGAGDKAPVPMRISEGRRISLASLVVHRQGSDLERILRNDVTCVTVVRTAHQRAEGSLSRVARSVL